MSFSSAKLTSTIRLAPPPASSHSKGYHLLSSPPNLSRRQGSPRHVWQIESQSRTSHYLHSLQSPLSSQTGKNSRWTRCSLHPVSEADGYSVITLQMLLRRFGSVMNRVRFEKCVNVAAFVDMNGLKGIALYISEL